MHITQAAQACSSELAKKYGLLSLHSICIQETVLYTKEKCVLYMAKYGGGGGVLIIKKLAFNNI
jgi:hypothetical protein